ncbi:MAG: nickel pincer cofactor biosynthesis protein LarC [Candidatus Elarobacter sp.]
MRIAYVEMIGGAAGDMLLGAFLDAGLDRLALESALRSVVADGWTFAPQRVVKRGIAATYAGLVVPGEDGDADHHHHADQSQGHAPGAHAGHPTSAAAPTEVASVPGTRTLADVLAIVADSGLTLRQRERAGSVYRRLAQAEAHVHGVSSEGIHFHEIGQIDAILDVAGCCIALDLLGIDELRCSSFPIGHGSIRMQHGLYPNPPPATAELMRGWPTRAVDVAGELVTTTAAAILTTLASACGRPDLVVERIGYGAGRSDFAIPNVTRVTIGTAVATAPAGTQDAWDGDEIVVLESNIDDMSPQHYELAMERLFEAGARDVWLTPIVMKKSRPAITLSAIAQPADEAAVARAMLRETTTIGVRVRAERRHILPRATSVVTTPYGPVRVKQVGRNGATRTSAEYDDLLRIARERGLPLRDVAQAVEASIAQEDRS